MMNQRAVMAGEDMGGQEANPAWEVREDSTKGHFTDEGNEA